jgi:hypothetical protein
MAQYEITTTVVPTMSTVAPYTYTNEYGNEVTTTEKSIANDSAMLDIFIEDARGSTNKLIQILETGPRMVLVFESLS